MLNRKVQFSITLLLKDKIKKKSIQKTCQSRKITIKGMETKSNRKKKIKEDETIKKSIL